MEITGDSIAALKKALADSGTYANQALASAMYHEMDKVITTAKARTPVDTGVLRASGITNLPDVQGDTITVEGGFGGAASAYAIPVHERMGVNHPTGRSKFLESAFLERVENMADNLAKRVELAWQRLSK